MELQQVLKGLTDPFERVIQNFLGLLRVSFCWILFLIFPGLDENQDKGKKVPELSNWLLIFKRFFAWQKNWTSAPSMTICLCHASTVA
jgi:hypothetical protein